MGRRKAKWHINDDPNETFETVKTKLLEGNAYIDIAEELSITTTTLKSFLYSPTFMEQFLEFKDTALANSSGKSESKQNNSWFLNDSRQETYNFLIKLKRKKYTYTQQARELFKVTNKEVHPHSIAFFMKKYNNKINREDFSIIDANRLYSIHCIGANPDVLAKYANG